MFKGESMKKSMLRVLFVWIVAAAAVSSEVVRAQEAPRRIEVTAKRFAFEPSEITLKKGQPVVFVIKSTDVAHGLSFRELHVDVKVPKGGTAELPFTPDKTGDFVGHCSQFCGSGHGSMILTLHVAD
jgi:cytochrome c oxidase subunit 2